MPSTAHGDTGWDVFSLDYHVDAPLSTILSNDMMQSYLTISNFLWRLKRVEHALSSAWHISMTARQISRLPAVRHTLHRSHLLRAEMLQLINSIQYYVMFEVLETSWQQLEQQMSKAAGLDDLIMAHKGYISSIMKGAMLDTAALPLLNALQLIFDTILRFRAVQVCTLIVNEQRWLSDMTHRKVSSLQLLKL